MINVINASIPAIFIYYNISLYWLPWPWSNAFDNQTSTSWNSGASFVTDYIYITLNDEYLLTSFQLTSYGDTGHDTQFIEYYLDENATCLAGNFTFPVPSSLRYTFSPTSFNYTQEPIIAKQILIGFIRWSIYQLWLPELALYGIPY